MERPQSVGKKITGILWYAVLFHTTAFASTWSVRPNTKIQSIKQAIELASPFDTVFVYPGTYFEKSIVITKPIHISGINRPVLEGEHKYEIILITSSNVTVEGFHLQHGPQSSMNDYAGIKISNSRNVTVRNNILKDMFFGIYFQGSSNCTADRNFLESFKATEQQAGNGVHSWKCDSIMVSNNYVTGHRDGIYFEFVTHSSAIGNTIIRNIRYGLHFMFSHHNSYIRNTFENNGAGVAVMYTHHVIMRYNSFKYNWGSASYGLLMKEITDSEVEGNLFLSNSSAIYMEGSSRIRIWNNNMENNGCALRIQASCDNNTIEHNNFKGNTFDVTTNGSLVLNTFAGNYWDKYEGYDLNRDGIGDVPYHPVSVYSMIIEQIPEALMLMRSFMVTLLEKTEKAIPSLTPENFKDDSPSVKPLL